MATNTSKIIKSIILPIIGVALTFGLNYSFFYDLTKANSYTLFTPIQMILIIFIYLCIAWSYFNWDLLGKKLFYFAIIPGILFLGWNYIYILTNYYFYDKQSKQEVIATVYSKHERSTGYRIRTIHYYTTLRFDDGQMIEIDQENLYYKVEIGDSVKICLYNGRWGIPVAREYATRLHKRDINK